MHRTCYSLPRSRMCPFREGIRKKPAPSLSVIVALDRDLMERILCPYGGEEELQDTGRSFANLSNTVETRDALSAEYCSLEIQGSPAVYTRSRIMEDTVPKAFHQYELSGGLTAERFILNYPQMRRSALWEPSSAGNHCPLTKRESFS